MKKICLAGLAFVILIVFMSTAQSQSPQQTLNQYISDLQNNPNDNALREKIIKHVQTMQPSPAIPEEARRYFVEGNALLKAAKAQKGYGLAIDAYRQCLLIAPWWAEALYNYAVALDLANQFDEGMNSLKLYIATNPGGEESRKAQDKIYEIGAKKKLAAQEREESSPQAVAAREQNKFEDWLKKIDGRRYTCPSGNAKLVLDLRGKVFVYGNITSQSGYHEAARFEIRGRVTSYAPTREQQSGGMTFRFWVVEGTYTISEDGDRITQRLRYNDGDVRENIFLWQR
jgi:tetratricopeptide (TPR) repeat protein